MLAGHCHTRTTMTLRTAVHQSKILTFVVLGAFVWLLLTLFEVLSTINFATGTATFVGQNALGGLAGVLVLTIVLGALVVLYSEITESDPAPQSWPPSEE
ncbi:hypothetical protein HISP_09740 [Haloarcula hispanica N601]|uniref:Uncharacterized protein n=3 Tax=Haloarcula hispanica TaxID=51589 RepID=V5TMT2_HALHI|nr:hypothetical protein HISP_09740 [Haloarcula hispanica N601]